MSAHEPERAQADGAEGMLEVSASEYVQGICNGRQGRDVVPISEARARLTELAEEVVGSGTESS